MHVVWKYPSAAAPRDPLRFYFPDDAFFIDHGTAIISNQEQNDTIVKIAYPSGKIIWSYGHPRRPGTAPGYLHEPDDAYLLNNGQITVADAVNCRVLVINPNGTVAHQIGTNGVCLHHPPASIGSPNGDTPLPDGNLLISEINGSWVSEYTRSGKLVWTIQPADQLPLRPPADRPRPLSHRRLRLARADPGVQPRRATFSTATTRRPGRAGSTTPRWPNCCPAASSWSTMTTTTAWSRSTRPPGRSCGSTASPAGTAPGLAGFTPQTASTCCCRTDRHQRTARPDEKWPGTATSAAFRAVHPRGCRGHAG